MVTITLPKSVQVYSDGVSKTLSDRIAAAQANTANTANVALPRSTVPSSTATNITVNAIDSFSASIAEFSNQILTVDARVTSLDSTKAPKQSPVLSGNTTIAGPIIANGSVGTSGQYLASSGNSGPYWATFSVAGTPSLDGVMSVGATTSRALGVGNTTVSGTLSAGNSTITGTASITGHMTSGPYAGSTTSGNVSGLEIKNNGGTGDSDVAAISYHCAGNYGIHQHLRADGYFGIGGWSATSWRWYVNMANGDMTAAGNVTAYSDPRLKEDIKPIESALAKVLGWTGYRYRWRQNSVIGRPGQYDYGILSPEIEKTAPELVVDSVWKSPEGNFYKTVVYDKLAPFFIEAFKEQQAQIEELKEQVRLLQQSLK